MTNVKTKKNILTSGGNWLSTQLHPPISSFYDFYLHIKLNHEVFYVFY